MNFEQLPLRDIHLPEAVSWWPPAPGWWLLAVLSAVLPWGAASILRWRCARRAARARHAARMTLYEEARRLLHALRLELPAAPGATRARHLARAWSRWLRRVAMSHYGRERVAGLSGPAWLAWLDRPLAPEQPFSRGTGRIPAGTLFRRAAPRVEDEGALWALSERWLQALQDEARDRNTGNAAP